jgi:hypothetical protein
VLRIDVEHDEPEPRGDDRDIRVRPAAKPIAVSSDVAMRC